MLVLRVWYINHCLQLNDVIYSHFFPVERCIKLPVTIPNEVITLTVCDTIGVVRIRSTIFHWWVQLVIIIVEVVQKVPTSNINTNFVSVFITNTVAFECPPLPLISNKVPTTDASLHNFTNYRNVNKLTFYYVVTPESIRSELKLPSNWKFISS